MSSLNFERVGILILFCIRIGFYFCCVLFLVRWDLLCVILIVFIFLLSICDNLILLVFKGMYIVEINKFCLVIN